MPIIVRQKMTKDEMELRGLSEKEVPRDAKVADQLRKYYESKLLRAFNIS